MRAIPTAQERQEARLERLIAHEKAQINHLSLAAPDEDAAWRATREAAIARCRVRLAGYIGELEEGVRGEKETSATSDARSDTDVPPPETVNAAWRTVPRQTEARDGASAQDAGRPWWENLKSTSGARSDTYEPPSESLNAAYRAFLRRIYDCQTPTAGDDGRARWEELAGTAE